MKLNAIENLSMESESMIKIALDTNMANGVSLKDFKTVEDFILFGITAYLKDALPESASSPKVLIRQMLQNLCAHYDGLFNGKTATAVNLDTTIPGASRVHYTGGKLEIYARDFRYDTRFLSEFQSTAMPYPDHVLDDIDPEDPPEYTVWVNVRKKDDSTQWKTSWEFYKAVLIIRNDVVMNPDELMSVVTDMQKLLNVIHYIVKNGIIDKQRMLPDIMNSYLREDLLQLDLEKHNGPLNLDELFNCPVHPVKPKEVKEEKKTEEPLPKTDIGKQEAEQIALEEEDKEVNLDPAPVKETILANSFTMKEVRLFTDAIFDFTRDDKAIELWPRLRAMETKEIIMFLRRVGYYFYTEKTLEILVEIFKKDISIIRKFLKKANIHQIDTRSAEHLALIKKFNTFVFRDTPRSVENSGQFGLVECRRTLFNLRQSDIRVLLKNAYDLFHTIDDTYTTREVGYIKSVSRVTDVNEKFIISAFNDAGFKYRRVNIK